MIFCLSAVESSACGFLTEIPVADRTGSDCAELCSDVGGIVLILCHP